MFLPLATTFPLIILAVPQVYAQVLTPLEEDQDGDGDPLNEEKDISWNCSVDLLASDTSQAMLGYKIEGTLSEDDCDFIMHYLSGQCEEQTAKGVNVTEVCNELLSDYLKDRDLYTKDFPIDIMHFGALMDEFKQKRALEEQENAREKANTPTWSEDLE